jgi:hypothetical protein
MLGLIRFGSPDDLPLLDDWLTNRTVVYEAETTSITFPIEARDLALFAAVRLTGQAPADFGFDQVETEPTLGYQPNSIGFKTAEARETAFAKWSDWRARQ